MSKKHFHHIKKQAHRVKVALKGTNWHPSKRAAIVVAVLLALGAIGGIGVLSLLSAHPARVSMPKLVYIEPEDDLERVCSKLEVSLQARSLWGLRLLGEFSSYKDHIHTGAYRFGPEDTVWKIFRDLRAGHQTPVEMVVPSTRTIGQLLQRVSPQIMADSADVAALLTDSAFIDSLGFNRQTLPALFIPNTYEVYWNMDARGFIRRMHREYQVFWNKQRVAQAQKLGLDPVGVSTLASIVEEETANNAEKPRVAGLYLNRLQRGIPLQADPTIKFSLQDFTLRRILFKHLAVDSPYNTYKHRGLPPGPIRIPSIVGLESVLNRADHKYLYMCAKEDFSGTHNFARTLSAHQQNARRYQQALNRRKIK